MKNYDLFILIILMFYSIYQSKQNKTELIDQ